MSTSNFEIINLSLNGNKVSNSLAGIYDFTKSLPTKVNRLFMRQLNLNLSNSSSKPYSGVNKV